jgi:hypothetical protein
VPNEEDICKRLDVVTDKLSTQARTLGLGLLAFCGGLLLKESDFSKQLNTSIQRRLLAIAALGTVVLLFDLLQYFALYSVARSALKKLEIEQEKVPADELKKTVEVDYDDKSAAFRASLLLFNAKVLILVIAAFWLAEISFRYLVLQ